MDGALGGVVGELAHPHGLVDHALAREGGVSVEQDGHGLLALRVTAVELLGPHLALHQGVDGLQVAGVGHHGQANVPVGRSVQSLNIGAEMVLDVTTALIGRL